MGTSILKKAYRLEPLASKLKAAISSIKPTSYLSAEYFRKVALENLASEHLFSTNLEALIKSCALPDGFCDFNTANKVDDYMGTKKRVKRDKMLPSPISTLHAYSLSQFGSEELASWTAAVAKKHAEQLQKDLHSIQAFRIRDLDFDFGCGVTVGEAIAALILISFLGDLI